jgi:hypothetical protein
MAMTQRDRLLTLITRLGYNQSGFAKDFHIPKDTVERWFANPLSKRYRECPSWLYPMLERLAVITQG